MKQGGQKERARFAPGFFFCSRMGVSEFIAKLERQDGEERWVAEIVVITRYERGEVTMKAGVLGDGLAADGCRNAGIARAAGEVNFQSRLADIVEPCFHGDAEVALRTRDDVSEPERDAGSNLAEIDGSASVQGVRIAADIVAAVEAYVASRWDNCCRRNSIVVGKDHLRAETEPATEGKPVQGGVFGPEAEIGDDVSSLLLEGGAVAEEVGACAEIEPGGERRRYVESDPSKAATDCYAGFRKRTNLGGRGTLGGDRDSTRCSSGIDGGMAVPAGT